LTLETSSVYAALGIDPDDAEWQDFALCAGQDVWRWYEGYESSTRIAQLTDQICLSCPVRKECLATGIENNEWGTWGGVFLSNGKVDKNKNAHKTPDIWESIREGIT